MTYVDDLHRSALGRYGRMRMSHLMADTTAELLAMADRIGVDPRWLQRPGTPYEHLDICLAKRRLAVAAGAIEVTSRDLVRYLRTKAGGSA